VITFGLIDLHKSLTKVYQSGIAFATMRPVTIQCPRCNGKGKATLTPALQKAVAVFKRNESISVAQFSKRLDCELTYAHHLMRRLLEAGVVCKVTEFAPAKYRLKGRASHRCQTPPASLSAKAIA
jgi:hypothetical protein